MLSLQERSPLWLVLLIALGQPACGRRSANEGASPTSAVPVALDFVAEDGVPALAVSDPLPDGAILRIGTARLRHNNHVNSVAFSPDGKLLATGSDDHSVRLWDAVTGKEVFYLKGHEDPVACVAFSPDGKTLASAGGRQLSDGEENDTAIRLWDVKTGKERQRLTGHGARVNSVAFSPDGKTLASAGKDCMVRLWELDTGKEIRAMRGHIKPILSIAFSPDGKKLASGGYDRRLVLWETTTGNELGRLDAFTDFVTSVAFSPDGKLLATATGGKTIHLWNAVTGAEVRRLEHEEKTIDSVTFSSDGKFLATGGWDKMAHVWEVATGREVHRFQPKHLQVLSVAFSPNGKVLAAGTGSGSIDRWDLVTGKEISRGALPRNAIDAIVFSPDARMLATGSPDGMVRLWKATTGELVGKITADLDNTGFLKSLTFSPDGTVLAANATHTPFDFHAWRVAQDLAKTPQPLFRCQGRSLAFLAADKVAHVRDGAVRIIRLPGGRTDRQFKVTEFLSECLAISPDGNLAATGGYSRQIDLRDVASGKLVRQFERDEEKDFGPVNALCFSPDGKTIASASGRGDVRLWDVTGDKNRRLEGHRGDVRCVAYAPDGKILVSGGEDWIVRLWDPSSGKQIHQFSGHTASITWLAFSPDGKRLASSSRDTTVLIWDMEKAHTAKE